jgi:fluoride ion exporter CrcB/FEX
MNQWLAFGLVFLGGGLGSVARYGLTVVSHSFFSLGTCFGGFWLGRHAG